jgi:predicted amino acid racemase
LLIDEKNFPIFIISEINFPELKFSMPGGYFPVLYNNPHVIRDRNTPEDRGKVLMNNNLDYLEQNILEIRKRIESASRRIGKEPENITLIAVSKTFPKELVKKAFSLGIKDFGESYVQEAVTKIESLDIKAAWHFIGHLQKNKVRPVVEHFDMIQSVDSVELLKRIDRICGDEKRVVIRSSPGESSRGGTKRGI